MIKDLHLIPALSLSKKIDIRIFIQMFYGFLKEQWNSLREYLLRKISAFLQKTRHP